MPPVPFHRPPLGRARGEWASHRIQKKRSVDVRLTTIDVELLDSALDLAVNSTPVDDSPEDESAWKLLVYLKTRLNEAHDGLDAA